jgi:hypothetical protein
MSFARIRALALIAVLVVAAGVLTIMALSKDTAGSEASDACPSGYVRANMKLPDDNQTININVFNATSKSGLANSVRLDFEYRKFHVVKTGNNPLKKAVPEVAIVRYGPKTVGAAYVVNAYFLNDAKLEYNPKRADESIDIILGAGFKQLATQTEVNQAFTALAGAGGPQLPEKACASGN